MEKPPVVLVTCQECSGRGKVRIGEDLKPVTCSGCNGKGKRPAG